MFKKYRSLFLILVGLVVLPGQASASDFAKEKRWADDIVDALIDGEAVWLTADQHKFLGIYTQTQDKNIKGAAIVLHGIGVHPNWPEVVYPLRVRLTERGWQTLSLQMPILRNGAEYDEYKPLFGEIAPRINAAIAFLKSKGIKNIVIIGHSLGSTMASYYLATNKAPEVSALVAIGVSGTQFSDPALGYFSSVTRIKIPILDIYGTDDIEPVLSSATRRAAIARESGNNRYTQVVVKGANHFFSGKDDPLVKQVGDWLDKTLN